MARFRGIPNKKAATDPVHTPVIGKGIETNISKAISPYLRYLFSNLLITLLNHQLKKRLKIFDLRLNHNETGRKNQTIKIPGIISPITETAKASQTGILK